MSRSLLERNRPGKDPSRLFAALGDRTRIRLVNDLSGGVTRSISELSHGLDMTRQAVTKHLDILEEAELVRKTKEGRSMIYQINPASFSEAKQYLDRVSAQWDQALDRLKKFVE